MRVDIIYAAQAWGLGLDEPFLPKLLKGLEYKSHAVGKVNKIVFPVSGGPQISDAPVTLKSE